MHVVAGILQLLSYSSLLMPDIELVQFLDALAETFVLFFRIQDRFQDDTPVPCHVRSSMLREPLQEFIESRQGLRIILLRVVIKGLEIGSLEEGISGQRGMGGFVRDLPVRREALRYFFSFSKTAAL